MIRGWNAVAGRLIAQPGIADTNPDIARRLCKTGLTWFAKASTIIILAAT